MRFFLATAVFFISTMAHAIEPNNIMEHPDWPRLEEASGMNFLKSKYHATLTCRPAGDQAYHCLAMTPEFKVSYDLQIITHGELSYIEVVDTPKATHFASERLKKCHNKNHV